MGSGVVSGPYHASEAAIGRLQIGAEGTVGRSN